MTKTIKTNYEYGGLNSVETNLIKTENENLILKIVCTESNGTQKIKEYKLNYSPNWNNKEFLFAINKLIK